MRCCSTRGSVGASASVSLLLASECASSAGTGAGAAAPSSSLTNGGGGLCGTGARACGALAAGGGGDAVAANAGGGSIKSSSANPGSVEISSHTFKRRSQARPSAAGGVRGAALSDGASARAVCRAGVLRGAALRPAACARERGRAVREAEGAVRRAGMCASRASRCKSEVLARPGCDTSRRGGRASAAWRLSRPRRRRMLSGAVRVMRPRWFSTLVRKGAVACGAAASHPLKDEDAWSGESVAARSPRASVGTAMHARDP